MLRGTTVESYYEGACVYRGDGSPDYILHPEGVVRATGQGLSHEYFLKDHLGSTRVVFNGNGAVLQATDYYPFGLEHTPKAKENENRYLYNGKELQDETFAGGVRLGWYDYGARFYDPQIGRWHTVDPMSEKFYDYSSYSYGQDNPIGSIDVSGHFVFKYASKYPELSRMLQNINKVLDNPNIMKGLQKFSGLDPEIIRQQFSPNVGPEIVVKELWYYHGLTPPDKKGMEIQLDQIDINHLVNSLKAGNTDEYNNALFLIVLTILHEYTHSGDIQIHGKRFADLGQPNENCLGYQFENETFGMKMFDIEDIKKFRASFEENNKDTEKNKKENEAFWNQVINLAPGSYHIVNGKVVKD